MGNLQDIAISAELARPCRHRCLVADVPGNLPSDREATNLFQIANPQLPSWHRTCLSEARSSSRRRARSHQEHPRSPTGVGEEAPDRRARRESGQGLRAGCRRRARNRTRLVATETLHFPAGASVKPWPAVNSRCAGLAAKHCTSKHQERGRIADSDPPGHRSRSLDPLALVDALSVVLEDGSAPLDGRYRALQPGATHHVASPHLLQPPLQLG